MTAHEAVLHARFEGALREAGAMHAGEAAWRELLERYREPWRHYHTLEHVAACLALLDRFRGLAIHPAEVELALWYHDVVYDPRARDNEQKSAELARAHLAAAGIGRAVLERIGRSIESTRTHEADEADAALVVDIDLSILGADPETYDRFETAIRLEFGHVPGPLFRLGRRRVLRSFLDRPVIYQVPALRDLLERQARANIDRTLRGGTTDAR